MAKYIAIAPDGISVTISSNFGTSVYKQGEVTYNDNLAKTFPSVFLKVSESKFEEKVIEPVIDFKEEVVEKVEEIVEAVKELFDDNEEVVEYKLETTDQPEVQPESEVQPEPEVQSESEVQVNDNSKKKKK